MDLGAETERVRVAPETPNLTGVSGPGAGPAATAGDLRTADAGYAAQNGKPPSDWTPRRRSILQALPENPTPPPCTHTDQDRLATRVHFCRRLSVPLSGPTPAPFTLLWVLGPDIGQICPHLLGHIFPSLSG